MSKKIPLTKGKFAIVDDEDYGWLNQWKWHYSRDRRTGYARGHTRTDGMWRRVSMHRLILGEAEGMETDHVNGNGLDNRRANLRICSRAENKVNSRKYSNNTSGYMGVYWDKERERWRAQINNSQHLGRFDDVEEAARAYDKAALELHGEFATLNFPSELGE